MTFLPRRLPPFIVAAAGRAGLQATTLLSMLMAIAVVDVATFGAFSVAWVVAVIAIALQYSGLYEFIVRCRDLEHQRDTLFWLLIGQGTLLGVLMAVAGAVAGDPWRPGLSWLALIPPLAAASAWCDAQLVRAGRAPTVAMIGLGAETASAAVLGAMLWLGERAGALIAWRLSATLIMLTGVAIAARTRPRLRFSRAAARPALHAAWPLQGTTFAQTLATYAADLLLAWHLNPAAAGAYRAASRMSVTGADLFLQPLRPMTWAALAHHEREDDLPAMREAYFGQLRVLTLLAWPTLVGLALFSGRIFDVLAREDWSGAAAVMLLLALARLPMALDFFLEPVLVCRGRPRLQFWARLAFTVILLLGVVVAARQGAVTVAVWQLGAAVVLGFVATVLVCRVLELPGTRVLQAAAPGAVMALLCAGIGEAMYRLLPGLPPLMRLVLAAGAMAACLLAGAWWLYRRGALRLPASA